MGMLLKAIQSGPLEKGEVLSTQELEADDDYEREVVDDDDEEEWEDVGDEEEWEDVEDGEDCEDVDDEDESEDIEDDDEWEDIDDDEDWEDIEDAESALLSSLRALMHTKTLSDPSDPLTQTHTLQDSSQHDSENDCSSDSDSSGLISNPPNDNSSVASSSDDSSSDDTSSSYSSSDDDLSDEDSSDFSDSSDSSDNDSSTKAYPPNGHLSFATIEEARTAYYSTLMRVKDLLVKWYHKDDVKAFSKFLIESAQASYAEQEEYYKNKNKNTV